MSMRGKFAGKGWRFGWSLTRAGECAAPKAHAVFDRDEKRSVVNGSMLWASRVR